MRKIVSILVTFLLLSAGLSIGVGVEAEDSDAEWTIMIYMGGDGHPEEISDEVVKDINEMIEVGTKDEINLILLVDKKGPADSQLYEIKDEKMGYPLSSINETWGNELDMTDPAVLNDFVSWGMQNYPADHYMLDMWGHGRSWEGMPLEDGKRLTLPDIEEGLNDIHLDLLGFDACTMSHMEAFYQLKDRSDVIVASEMEEALGGWPYGRILKDLNEEPEVSPENFSESIVSEFVSWGEEHYSEVSSSLTAIDTSTLPSESFESYIDTLGNQMPYYRDEIERARDETETYRPDPNPVDLYHLTQQVDNFLDSKKMRRVGNQLRLRINQSVIAHDANTVTSGTSAINSHGIGLYFPLDDIPESYSDLKISDTGWNRWLQSFQNTEDREVGIDIAVEPVENESEVRIHFENPHPESRVKIQIYGEGELVEDYTFSSDSVNQTMGLIPEIYSVETYLIKRGDLLNHSLEQVTVTDTFTIEGEIDADDEVKISVFNNQTKRWKNFTTDPGRYSIELSQPNLCMIGDELKIDYVSNGETTSRTVTVEEKSVEKDVEVKNWFNFFNWMMIVELVALSILGSILLIRKSKISPKEG